MFVLRTTFVLVLIFFTLSLKAIDSLQVNFELVQSIIDESKKSGKVTHYIAISISKSPDKDLGLKIVDTKQGSAKGHKITVGSYTFKPDKASKERPKKGIFAIEIPTKPKKVDGIETIVLELKLDSASQKQPVKIVKNYHTVIIQYTGLYNKFTTSVGTNFDYLNGGIQAKDLYWDISYFEPSINSSDLALRAGLYQSRNFSIDSSLNIQSRPNSNFTLLAVKRGSMEALPDTLIFQRRTFQLNSQTVVDNYGFFFDWMYRVNPLSDQINFYFSSYGEIILKRIQTTTAGVETQRDTVQRLNMQGSTFRLANVRLGTVNDPALEIYTGFGVVVHHLSKGVEFFMAPYITYNYSTLNGRTRRGLTGVIKMMFKERNSGIKLGFEFRNRGVIDDRDFLVLNLSKTFLLGKSSIFSGK